MAVGMGVAEMRRGVERMTNERGLDERMDR